MKLLRLAILLLVCSCYLLLAGCSQSRLKPPEVSLVDVEFSDITLFQTTLKVVTSVRNENPESINFTGSLHKVSLNGIDIGKAINKDTFRLAPLESRQVISELQLSHLTFASRIQDILNSKNLRYELESEFYTGSGPFSGKTIKSSSSGTLIQSFDDESRNRKRIS